MVLAAIDIGSNAVRMLVTDAKKLADGRVDYTKLNFLRVPVRLGIDVFSAGSISLEKIDVLVDTIRISTVDEDL